MRVASCLLAAWVAFAATAACYAHPGGLDSNGGHHDRKNGGYHYHGGGGGGGGGSVGFIGMPAVVIRDGNYDSTERFNRFRAMARTRPRTTTPKARTAPPETVKLLGSKPDVASQLAWIKDASRHVSSPSSKQVLAKRIELLIAEYPTSKEAREARAILDGWKLPAPEADRKPLGVVATLADRERLAAAKLKAARTLLMSGKVTAAKELLTEIVELYPETKSAPEAQELLDTLLRETRM